MEYLIGKISDLVREHKVGTWITVSIAGFILSIIMGTQGVVVLLWGISLISSVISAIDGGWKAFGLWIWKTICLVFSSIPKQFLLGVVALLTGLALLGLALIVPINGNTVAIGSLGQMLILVGIIYPIAISIHGKKKE